MRGRTCSALIFLLLLSAQSSAETACVDLAQLAHSTVGITRYFDEAERNAQPDVVGIHGTAWFQSPTMIVTAAHVASGMKLSTQEWKSLKLEDDADSQSISVRIGRVAGGHADRRAPWGGRNDMTMNRISAACVYGIWRRRRTADPAIG